jgi:hypothetical protein
MSDENSRAEDALASRRMWLEMPGFTICFIGLAALMLGQWVVAAIVTAAGVLVVAASLLWIR